MPQIVHIGDKKVGQGQPTFVIAATGSGWSASDIADPGQRRVEELRRAKEFVVEVAESGANAINFQDYSSGKLYHESSQPAESLRERHVITNEPGAFAEHMASKAMKKEWHAELSALAHEKGIAYIPSVFGDEELEYLIQEHKAGRVFLDGLSIESLDHSDSTSFVKKVAVAAKELNIPVIMATGVQSPGSVKRAVKAAGRKNLILLHTVEGTPAPAEEVGFKDELPVLKQLNGDGVVGFLDKTVGGTIEGNPVDPRTTVADAIINGSQVHMVQVRNPKYQITAPKGPHRALSFGELKEVIDHARITEADPAAKSSGLMDHLKTGLDRSDLPSERSIRSLGRVAIPTVAIKAGTALTKDNITTRRGGGKAYLPAEKIHLGEQYATRELTPDAPISTTAQIRARNTATARRRLASVKSSVPKQSGVRTTLARSTKPPSK